MDIKRLKIGIKKSSLLLALLVLSSITLAADIKLTWDTPTEREDGSTIQAIEKFNLYYTVNNALQDVIEIDASANTYTMESVEIGTHILQISTVEDGQEGERSDPITATVLPPKENARPQKMIVSGHNLTIEIIE